MAIIRTISIKAPLASIKITIKSDAPPGEFEKRASGIVGRSRDFKPVLIGISRYLMHSMEKNFKRRGRPRKWPKLAPATIRDRAAKGFPRGPILVRTGRLKRSLTKQGDQNQALAITNNRLRLGSRVKYYPYHQRGTNRIPQRIMAVYQSDSKKKITEMVLEYLAGKK